MKVFFQTLGCKVNQYESQAMLNILLEKGFLRAEGPHDADVVVINPCTVTSTSDQKVRQTLHRARRKNPGAVIVLTGCMTQAFPDLAEQMTEADVILGNRNRALLPEAIQTYLSTHRQVVQIEPHQTGETFETMRVPVFHDRTRAFVKIEDGCDRFCSYCIIPTARGPVRSKPLDALEEELRALAKAGYVEIVLVGINLSAYGQDLGHTLCDAVETACGMDGVKRVRLGSLEPDHMDGAVIKRLAAQSKLCPAFHLSLQSGCDETLRRMNRHYTTADYDAIVQNLRRSFPGCCVTTDVMVGFPGETEAEFLESLAFARRVGFEKVHVFSYSRRAGTRAAEAPGQVSNAEKERRSKKMIEETNRIRADYLRGLIGKTYPVLFESPTDDGIEGYTPHYVPVRVSSDQAFQGTIRPVKITGAFDDHCIGHLADSFN